MNPAPATERWRDPGYCFPPRRVGPARAHAERRLHVALRLRVSGFALPGRLTIAPPVHRTSPIGCNVFVSTHRPSDLSGSQHKATLAELQKHTQETTGPATGRHTTRTTQPWVLCFNGPGLLVHQYTGSTDRSTGQGACGHAGTRRTRATRARLDPKPRLDTTHIVSTLYTRVRNKGASTCKARA